MKLKSLKAAIDKAVEYAGECDPDVEVWTGSKMRRITSVGQFSIVPDLVITLGKVELDLKDCRVEVQP